MIKSAAVPIVLVLAVVAAAAVTKAAADSQPKPLRVALVKQPFIPNGTSVGPRTMADGGIQAELKKLGAEIRVNEIGLTKEQEPEYGGWKRLGFALGHLGRAVQTNVRDGFFNVGLLGTCPSMPGMVAGLQRSGPTNAPDRKSVV